MEASTESPVGPRFLAAVGKAAYYHAGQYRKGTEIPYLAHVLAVAALVLEDEGTEDEAIAALLHDAIEDAEGGVDAEGQIREEFGEVVVSIVKSCSDTEVKPKPKWHARKQHYLEHLQDESVPHSVLRVSLADKLHNARAILWDYRLVGDTLWERFSTGSGADQRWYYERLAEIFLSRCPGPMADELDRVVREIADMSLVRR